ncbi:hypothetical protein [Methanoregula sp.]|uniref:hypothetical protein n=1 Tax=Methanoregula sp. TaxID=2052170 RepID=UPI00236ECCF2|nr:hypothetical protein [Methanoregula sp.]MDD1686223.1 hypothetical protein [Methanoregula sp.]
MDKTLKIIAAVLAVVVVASIAVLATGTLTSSQKPAAAGASAGTIYFFYGEECVHCHNVMPFILNMTKKYPEADIQLLEVWHNQTNNRIFQQALAAAGETTSGVPRVIAGTTVLTGEVEIPEQFESLIQASLKKKR